MDSHSAPQKETSSVHSQESGASLPSFAELGISADLCLLVKGLGYELPTPIQIKSIPTILAGKDLIGQAQTGTGKTAAFALPLLSRIDFALDEPQVLVLTPTRELAIQVAEAFKTYARDHESFHVLPIYGGQSIGIQLRQLKRNPQVIVGTPGRIMDHLKRGTLSLGALRALVIDEADEMLSMGFLEDMEWIISNTPAEKQTTLFSATMPRDIRRIAQQYLRNPQEIVIRQAAAQAALIHQTQWLVNGLHKLDALTRVLELNEFDAMLVFVRTKTATLELAEKLEARGYSVGPLNGDMTQEARERTIERLKQGRLDIVVATDVAARGLDVERISHVINYDIPFDAETYTHRIGRTGRAGRNGTAILFVSDRERGLLRSIERGTNQRLEPFKMPTREDINRRRNELFKATISAALSEANEPGQLSAHLELVQSLAAEHQTSEANIAAVICSMLQKKLSPAPVENEKRMAPNKAEDRGRPGGRRDSDPRGGFNRGRRSDREAPSERASNPFGKKKGPGARDSDGPRARYDKYADKKRQTAAASPSGEIPRAESKTDAGRGKFNTPKPGKKKWTKRPPHPAGPRKHRKDGGTTGRQ